MVSLSGSPCGWRSTERPVSAESRTIIALASGGGAPPAGEEALDEEPRRMSERREAGDWTAETMAVGIEDDAEEMKLAEGENIYGLAIMDFRRGESHSVAPRVGGTPPRISVKAWRRNAAMPRTKRAMKAENVVWSASEGPGVRRT